MDKNFTTVDEYIALYSPEEQILLQEVRKAIHEVAPEASETISYQMPTFRFNGNLIHFALYKNHLGIYPGSTAIEHFSQALSTYKTTKGAIQLPIDRPLPKDIIQKIVRFNLNLLQEKSSPDWKRYHTQWEDATKIIEQIVDQLPLTKTFKWGGDVYTFRNKNVFSYRGFKNYFAIWFYNGVFLSDPEGVLVSASEGKTKSLRQWRITSIAEIDVNKVKMYIEEAIQTVLDGKEIKMEKMGEKTVSGILKNVLDANLKLQEAFEQLTPGKRKDYIIYIEEAKQDKTKMARIEKIIPLILTGKGLNDKYKPS
ncbi:DUF1801 domain-containing protein [Sphingobacterium sp. LRF_L2]|uniref:DUF1801 domain-containing protein n=1 Tax=Sphingobacterium sp. LRF_L2 TaxID=3369421 RepID=UPI003F5F1CAE